MDGAFKTYTSLIRSLKSGKHRFSYFRTTEQNRHGFVQSTNQKIKKHLLTPESLYGRNADILYYFTYVEGNASYYTTYSMCIIIPSIIGAACFQPVFRKLNNKGRTASVFALLTGIAMLTMFFFNAKELPVVFYTLSGLTQFFFSGFNTAIYAIIPDCVEYGERKTGLRNDGFQ